MDTNNNFKKQLYGLIIIVSCLNFNCSHDKILLKNGDTVEGRIIDISEFDIEMKNKSGKKSYRKYDVSKILLNGETIKFNHSLTDLVYIRTDEARENLCTEFFDCKNFRSCDKQLTNINSLVFKNGDYSINEKILARITIVEEIGRKKGYCDWHDEIDCSGLQITYKIKINGIIAGNQNINSRDIDYIVSIRTCGNSDPLNINEEYIAEINMELNVVDCNIKRRKIVSLNIAFGNAFDDYKIRYAAKYYSQKIRDKLFTLDEIKECFIKKEYAVNNLERDTVKVEKDYRKPVSFLVKLALVNFVIFVLPFIILSN